jgi:hypothetical protein
VKYVVASRLSPEALAESPHLSEISGGGVEWRTRPLPLEEAKQEQQAREAQPLLILGRKGGAMKIGMMYAEVWIEDENGNRVASPENRVTSPEKRVD